MTSFGLAHQYLAGLSHADISKKSVRFIQPQS
jgi:hypothetical protein